MGCAPVTLTWRGAPRRSASRMSKFGSKDDGACQVLGYLASPCMQSWLNMDAGLQPARPRAAAEAVSVQDHGVAREADDVVELTSRLVEIDSVNPALVAGGAGESAMAAFVLAWARAAGLEAELFERTPGRPSVVARARGS